ncbi:MAG: hypothetical protein CSA34_05215 [Desulfobulbus propionicus]|nr:MAG: hypothetical protein CSA34_05215 [Desulfobulbus propionicus]
MSSSAVGASIGCQYRPGADVGVLLAEVLAAGVSRHLDCNRILCFFGKELGSYPVAIGTGRNRQFPEKTIE